MSRDVFAQIDYVIYRNTSKMLLQNAKSFGGSKVDTDHNIVVAMIDLGKYQLKQKVTVDKKKKYDISKLNEVESNDVKKEFRRVFDEKMSQLDELHNNTPDSKMECLIKCLKETEQMTVPEIAKDDKNKRENKELAALIENKNDLYLKIRCNTNISDINRSTMKQELNRMRRAIKTKIIEIDTHEADSIVDDIEKSKDNAQKMFNAAKLAKVNNARKSIKITMDDGTTVMDDKQKVDIIKEFFEKQMTKTASENETITPGAEKKR